METKIYKDKQEVAERFSAYFAELVKEYGTFHVALSGGSTPRLIFDALAEPQTGEKSEVGVPKEILSIT